MTPLFHLPAPLDPSATLDAREGQTVMYLAGLPVGEPAPEVPCIGSNGPRSKALTKNIIFQLYLTGKLAPRRRGFFLRFREKLALLARRWETFCAEEPPLQRHHRPSLFAPFDSTPIFDFDNR